jgi:hypothetical protein
MLLTLFPCFINIGRTRLLTVLFGEVTPTHIRVFNFSFMFVGTVLSFVSPFFGLDILMDLVGAILCFFFIYLIPIKFHLACIYEQSGHESTVILSSDSNKQSLITKHSSSVISTSENTDSEGASKYKCPH